MIDRCVTCIYRERVRCAVCVYVGVRNAAVRLMYIFHARTRTRISCAGRRPGGEFGVRVRARALSLEPIARREQRTHSHTHTHAGKKKRYLVNYILHTRAYRTCVRERAVHAHFFCARSRFICFVALHFQPFARECLFKIIGRQTPGSGVPEGVQCVCV